MFAKEEGGIDVDYVTAPRRSNVESVKGREKGKSSRETKCFTLTASLVVAVVGKRKLDTP